MTATAPLRWQAPRTAAAPQPARRAMRESPPPRDRAPGADAMSRPPSAPMREAGPDPWPDERPRTRMLVLQPTPFCNIDCDYCYLPARDDRRRMSIDTVRLAVQRLVDDGLVGDALTVVWHAGEPLTVPVAFYEAAFAAIAEVLDPHGRVEHAIQTNATLIDDAWCGLFARHGVRVGVSVDGPAELHDRHRRTRRGGGTHARVLQGLARLRAHGLVPHAIAVVTRETLAQPDAFFDFFVSEGIREVGCNFDEAEGVHAASSLAGHEAAHAAFLERLLERSLASEGRLVVRELAQAARLIAEPLPTYRRAGADWPDNAQVMPLALLTVTHDGRFGTFSPELPGQRASAFDDFVIGNVHASGYLEAARRAPATRWWPAVARGVEACRERCAYFACCGGGAPANKWYELGDLAGTETLYCRSMVQRPLEIVLRRLERACGTAPAQERTMVGEPA